MKIFVECECHTEMLSIETEYENKTIYLAFWNCGQNRDGHTGFCRKWHLIKSILKHGTPYSDMIILRTEEVDKLIAALQRARIALKDKKPNDQPA